MAGFGTGGFPHPRRTGPRPMEALAPINVHYLSRHGALVGAGTVTRWQWSNLTATIAVEHSSRILIAVDGAAPVPVTIVREPKPYNGERAVFVCPACSQRWFTLYVKAGVIGCRGCHRLDYRSRHEARAGVARALHPGVKLRRRLGGDLTPFGPLPPRPRHHMTARVYDRLVARLAIYESQAAAVLGDMIGAIERRARHHRERANERPNRQRR